MGTVDARCRRQCIEARSADQSARSAENFFQLSGWALVAPSFFALQVPYVRGSMLRFVR